MVKKKTSAKPKKSLSTLLEGDDDDKRESFFKEQTTFSETENEGRERLSGLLNTIAASALFRTKRSVAAVTAVVSIFLTLSLSSLWAPNTMDTTTLAARISGGVALTESQLREVVREIDQRVYWAGPMSGAKYTINAQNFNSIYVRYLADGEGISDQTPKYRVIATYKEANAYNSTLSAGNQANGLSFTKPDGRVVYYNKQVPTNVYVAFKNDPYQMEIFDPDAKKSLAIANSESDLQVIK